jgi:hypothetical protein
MPSLLFNKFNESRRCFDSGEPIHDSIYNSHDSNINMGQAEGSPSSGSKMFHVTSEEAKP